MSAIVRQNRKGQCGAQFRRFRVTNGSAHIKQACLKYLRKLTESLRCTSGLVS